MPMTRRIGWWRGQKNAVGGPIVRHSYDRQGGVFTENVEAAPAMFSSPDQTQDGGRDAASIVAGGKALTALSRSRRT